jgi:hypothetical protein
MLNNKVTSEANQAAPEISPDLLAELKQQDMEQAVVERFRSEPERHDNRTAARHGVHTSAWRSTDDEC